jgi:outer membrane protein, multidrug efflux system
MLFNSGYATYLEVVNSQRVALNTELNYNQLKLSKLNARIKLYKALGGGWN